MLILAKRSQKLQTVYGRDNAKHADVYGRDNAKHADCVWQG